MKTFIYEVTKSPERACGDRVTVYRVKHNLPEMIGHKDEQNAYRYHWQGESREAHGIIGEYLNLSKKKYDPRRQNVTAPDIAIYALGSNWNEAQG